MTLAVAFGVVPIVIYKLVFSSMWREAALIWLVATVIQAGVTYGMIVVGIVSLAAFTSGA